MITARLERPGDDREVREVTRSQRTNKGHLKLQDMWSPSPGGGYFRQFRIGVCRQGSQTLTLFKGRKSRIDTLFKKAQNQEMAPYLRETR